MYPVALVLILEVVGLFGCLFTCPVYVMVVSVGACQYVCFVYW